MPIVAHAIGVGLIAVVVLQRHIGRPSRSRTRDWVTDAVLAVVTETIPTTSFAALHSVSLRSLRKKPVGRARGVWGAAYAILLPGRSGESEAAPTPSRHHGELRLAPPRRRVRLSLLRLAVRSISFFKSLDDVDDFIAVLAFFAGDFDHQRQIV